MIVHLSVIWTFRCPSVQTDKPLSICPFSLEFTRLYPPLTANTANERKDMATLRWTPADGFTRKTKPVIAKPTVTKPIDKPKPPPAQRSEAGEETIRTATNAMGTAQSGFTTHDRRCHVDLTNGTSTHWRGTLGDGLRYGLDTGRWRESPRLSIRDFGLSTAMLTICPDPDSIHAISDWCAVKRSEGMASVQNGGLCSPDSGG